MIASWALCYRFSFTSQITKFSPTLKRCYSEGDIWAAKKLQRWTFLQNVKFFLYFEKFFMCNVERKNLSLARLSSSGAEAFVLRKFAYPVTIPAKFAVAIFVTKQISEAQSTGQSRN